MIENHNTSIIIADDHPMLLSGLYEELVKKEYNVLGKAENGTKALGLILELQPDIALLDVDMPYLTGFEVVKLAKEKGVKTRFIILSLHKESEFVAEAKSLNVQGYLLKEDSFSEIENCIAEVLNGEEYYSKTFESKSLKNASDELKNLLLLTFSEMAVLKLVAQGKTNKQIGELLCVSHRTVEKHRSHIILKLALESGNNTLLNWANTHKNTILNQ